ncbi:MAG: hypothetical protein ABIA37_05030 [Candidatus Woesearchaeota archaeon]
MNIMPTRKKIITILITSAVFLIYIVTISLTDADMLAPMFGTNTWLVVFKLILSSVVILLIPVLLATYFLFSIFERKPI